MALKSRTKHQIIKAKGTARYPHINEPYKKFEPEFGVYTCDVIVDKEQADAIKDTLRPLYEQELQEAQKQNPSKKLTQRDFPIEEVDGGFLVKTKKKGGHRSKGTGEVFHFSIAVYDSKAKPLDKDVQVWSGSEVVVAFRPNFYNSPAIGFGVSLELEAVQVLKLGEGGVSSVAASSFGFTEQEEGFVNGGENLDGGFDAETTEEEEVIANF
jgi:hypothetical protein